MSVNLKNKIMKKIISIVLISAIGGALTLGAYKLFFERPTVVENIVNTAPSAVQTSLNETVVSSIENTDFTLAAEKSLHAVVHVKNTAVKTYTDPFAEFFYGQGSGNRQYSQVGTGSGVIISKDGYIITNNHVIRDASEIEVTLNNKKAFKAELIGADAVNDIALLKIDATDLPYIVFGDSNALKIGEWVLAVGNPYNLTSTVTAGIVSAKGRDLDGNNGVDSFIQTDAAVNPGNSGGALVNTRGELIGINTAITSRTGSFIGYSFAVPSNIAKKVIEDIMEYGTVQKAILGVKGAELDSKIADNFNLDKTEGFVISEVTKNSGAEKAGLKENDVIIGMDNVKIASFSDLTGFLRTKRPDDQVVVKFYREGEEKMATVKLSKNEISAITTLGLELRNLNNAELKKMKLDNGVEITDITNEELVYYGVKKGYIITAVNNKKVYDVDDVTAMIEAKGTGEVLRIEIVNLKGETERYIFR